MAGQEQKPAARTAANITLEVEQGVLGALLLDNSAFEKVAKLLGVDDFSDEGHQLIYRAIGELIAEQRPADTLTVADWLEHEDPKGLAKAGGHAYLGSLALNTPSSANARRYAEIVRERALARRARAGAMKSKRKASRAIDWSEFFERFTLIYPTETAWDAHHEQIVKLSAMRAAFGRREIEFWLASPERRMVNAENVIFDPAAPLEPPGKVNLFRGMKFKPVEGDCSKLLALLHWLCGEDDQVFDWVLKWTAYPLQHPGAKMQTALVMYGHEGTGKNLFWSAVSQIYGDYGGFITQFQLQSQFNDWASRKLFMVANEVVTRMELRHLVGYLKTLVTEERIPIEAKQMPVRLEDNRMQLVFLSNELRPLHLGPGDRRYMAIRTPGARDAEYYSAVSAELAAGGAAALYYYLLKNVELGDFHAHTKPVVTQAKRDLIELGMSSTQLFWQELHDEMVGAIPYGPCLVQDAYRVYVAWCVRSGVKLPEPITRFSHEFMSMNGVSRRALRVPDPDRPGEYALPAERRPQRKVFLMGARPEDISEPEWVKKNVENFREKAKQYLGERQLGRQSDQDAPYA